MKNQYRFIKAHPRVRQAHFDTVALLPGSLLSQIEELHTIAGQLPVGTMLVVEPALTDPHRDIYERIVPMLRAAGYQVQVMDAQEMGEHRHQRPVHGVVL